MRTRRRPVMPLTTRQFAALLGLAPALAGQAPLDVDAELRRVRAEVDAGRVADGQRRLRALLDQPECRSGLIARRELVVDEARRIEFARAYATPDARDLVRGALHEWVPRSGTIDLRYGPGQVDDFVHTADDAWLHPLRFVGDHAIELRGERYPDVDGGLRLFVDVSALSSHVVMFGSASAQVPVQISSLSAAGCRNLGVAASPLQPGRAYVVSVRVTATHVIALAGGREVLRVKKAAPEWGQFALAAAPAGSLRIVGQVSPAWFDARRDQRRQQALAEFSRQFAPQQHLPAWLIDAPPPDERRELAYPGLLTTNEASRLDAAVRLVDAERYHDALAEAAERLAAGGAEPAWVFVRALAFAGQGQLAHAIACLDEVLRLHPEFARGARLSAQLRWRMGQRDAALAVLRAHLAKVPDDAAAAAELVAMELRRGRPDLAAKELAAARDRGVRGEALDNLAATLAKAERGPDWPQRHEYRSRHYEVASDIDVKICVEVANVLEEALATFCAELGPIELGDRRLRVFVFSGESGYRAYYEGVLGTVRLHTSGLYSATLEQLLLWQANDRERLLQTARHEGLHQYLAIALRDPPIWFNEGLASYYESASARGERRGAAMARALRLRALASRAWLPLRDLLDLRDAEFHADAARAYAQSWALVRLLREGTAHDKQLFRALFDGLRQGRATTVAEVFTPERTAELDARLRAWVADQLPAAPSGR